MPTVPEMLSSGLQHHSAGRLADAERAYREILTIDPTCAKAWHYLGLIAYQTSQNESALQYISKALQLDPNDAEAHNNLGNTLKGLGQLNGAIECYRRAIALAPEVAEIHNNLGNFVALSSLPGIQLICLQKEIDAGELSQLSSCPHIHRLPTDFDTINGAFMDTAAIMKNLDLVITSDTAIAHLAGALGVPVWVALPFVPDWRWLLDHSDSPWYPTMRLFRQKSLGDWPGVFAEIKTALAALVSPLINNPEAPATPSQSTTPPSA